MPAKYDLDLVQKLVVQWLSGDDQKIWFTPRRKSYGAVSFLFGDEDAVAQKTIATGMLQLKEVGFCKSQFLAGRREVVDVYGLPGFLSHNWYVKFYVHVEDDDECIAAISFHPLDRTMTCENGDVLHVTYQGARPWKNE